MSKDLNISVLMDFYGSLLTEKQKDALELYYNCDFSLSEIACDLEISRQGVRDSIKRGEKQLIELEDKLGLAKKFSHMSEKLTRINELADALGNHENENIRQIRELCNELLEEF